MAQAAYCNCSGTVWHRQSRRTAQSQPALARAHGLRPAAIQPYIAVVCLLMVSTTVIHVITWITTHLLTQEGWKANWVIQRATS